MLTTFRDYDIVMYYGGSCFRPNIVGFNSRDQTQTIPDPDLHPRRPMGQGQGLNYKLGQGSIMLTTFRDYDIVMNYVRSCFRPNIVGFDSRDHTQTIPDPDLHPRRPVGQGQGLNYEKGQGSIMLTTFRGYHMLFMYCGCIFCPIQLDSSLKIVCKRFLAFSSTLGDPCKVPEHSNLKNDFFTF